MIHLQVEILMPDPATYLDYVESASSDILQTNRNVSSNISKVQERQKTQYRKRKLVSGETATFQEGQLVLVYNARKRGQKGKSLEKKWLLPPRKILKIDGKTALLEGMNGKVNTANLKLVPEGLNKEDFHFERTFTTREDMKPNDIKTFEASVVDDVLSNVEQNTSSSFIALNLLLRIC